MKGISKLVKRGTAIALAAMMTAGAAMPQGSAAALAKEAPKTAVTASIEADAEQKLADRTVLMYICGSDLETRIGVVTQAFNKMMEAKIADGINVIVLTGGVKQWNEALYTKDAKGDKVSVSNEYNQVWKMTGRTDTESHGYMELIEPTGIQGAGEATLSMEEPEMLRRFLDYGYDKYPAKTYDLICLDHGMGPTRGFCSDDVRPGRRDGKEYLSMADIAMAIKESKIDKFDFIDFFACLMGNFEIATALAPYTDYLITSSEVLPGQGEDLKSWLDYLSEDKTRNGWELGKKMVDTTVEFYEDLENKSNGEATLAVTNTKNFVNRLMPKMNELAAILDEEAHSKGAINGKYNFYDELYSKKQAIKFSDPNLFDIGNMINALGIDLNEPDNSTSADLDQLRNKYTDTAVAIDKILKDNDNSGDEVIYASCSKGIRRAPEVEIDRDTNGNLIDNDMLDYTGLSMYFGVENTPDGLRTTNNYINAMTQLLNADTDMDTVSKTTLRNYMKAMLHYTIISQVGKAVSELSAKGDKEITLDDVKNYLMTCNYGNSDGTKVFKEYDLYTKAIATAEANETWVSDIIKQQADEAVSSDKIAINAVEDDEKAGEKGHYNIHIEGVPASVVDGAYVKLIAKVKSSEEGKPDNEVVLSRQAVSGEPCEEYYFELSDANYDPYEAISKIYSDNHTMIDMDEYDNQWFALKASDGSVNVVASKTGPDADGNLIIPIYLVATTPTLKATKGALKVHYDEETNKSTILGFLPGNYSFADSEFKDVETEKNGLLDISAKEFDNMSIILTAKAEGAGEDSEISKFIPLGEGPDRGLSIEKKDFSEMPTVTSVSAYYTIEDTYGYTFDITDDIKAADSKAMLKNLSHAVISNIRVGEDGYIADVKYGDTDLEYGKDFDVIQMRSDKVGAVDLAFVGMGDYAGYQMASVPVVPPITDLSKAKVNLRKAYVTYNGKVQKPAVKSVVLDGYTVPSSAYSVSISAKNPKNAGTYTVKITGKASENFTGSATAKFTINQAANTIKFAGKTAKKAVTVNVKQAALKKKAKTYNIARYGKGKISIKKKSSAKLNKYVSLSGSKVVLKKGAPKGKYKFIITVAAKGNWKKTSSKVITVNVK